MTFKPYHYDYIDEVIRYYASSLGHTDIIDILNNGISTEREAKIFCDFIPLILDQHLVDEEAGKSIPIEIGSAMIPDLHYEASSFVCDAGFESIWDAMIDKL